MIVFILYFFIYILTIFNIYFMFVEVSYASTIDLEYVKSLTSLFI